MPSDVRKMSDEEIKKVVRAEIYLLDPTAVAALDELSRRLKIMRELCDSANAVIFAKGMPEIPDGMALLPHDFIPRRETYRQMEAEREKD